MSAISPNAVTCSRSLQHTCSLHWESGCTQSELAMRSTRSTKPRRKIVLGPTKRIEQLRETWNNAVDQIIPGMPLTTVEQQDTTRENKVKKLIERFENHQHKESFIQDLSQTRKINKFSEQSKDLIADLNNTEIFELSGNSSKQQCLECNAYWELGIICCSCGRNMKSTRSPTEFDQNNRDVTSIPGCVIKKKQQSRCQTRSLWKTKDETDASKGPTGKARTPPDDTCTMLRERTVQNFVVSHRVERKRHNAIWENCLRETFPRRYKSWENSKFEELDSHNKCWRT